MPLSTQMKMLRAVREIILGDGRNALPRGNEPKPDYRPEDYPRPEPLRLERSTPEREGLPSRALDQFYRELAALPQCNAHAVMVLRHGKVVSEGYFAPFNNNVWHVTHSLCKTFTGTAVGLAIDEGLFDLDDKVVPYFPEAGFLVSRRHKAITVRHLLTMRSGLTFNELSEAVETDWLKGIFSSPVAFDPGTEFVYNSMNNYLLAALVCKTSGQSLMEFLEPRIFAPLGFGPIAWEKSPEGYEKGGWGMYMMLEDMAKFGQLYLQKGLWTVNGRPKQLISRDWVELATDAHTTSDRELSYGCQCWVDPEDQGYTMNGMFGQYITVLPRQGVVIAMNAGSPRLLANSSAYKLFNRFFSALGQLPEQLPEAPGAHAALKRTLDSLAFRKPVAGPPAPAPARLGKQRPRGQRWAAARQAATGALPAGVMPFTGQTWCFETNRGGILPIITQAMNNNFTGGVRALHLRRQPDHLTLLWEEGKGTLTLPVGWEKPLEARIQVGRESYYVASTARLATNEDGTDVLMVEVVFLEHSSFRLLKLIRQEGNILLKLDEQPSFATAIDAMISQEDATGAPGGQKKGLGDVVLQNDYMQYRVNQLCTPQMVGKPVEIHKKEGT